MEALGASDVVLQYSMAQGWDGEGARQAGCLGFFPPAGMASRACTDGGGQGKRSHPHARSLVA